MRNFSDVFARMKEHGMSVPETGVHISIDNARLAVKQALEVILSIESKQMQWIKPYDEVADWLTDNKGLGLFMYGNCGLGKSLIARYVIPGIILQECNKVVSVYDTNEMNANIDEVLSKKILCIDDVGTEEISVKFGERRLAFAEVMDTAEKMRNLVIATSNLNFEELSNRYGERVVDRIKSTTRRIVFTGKSFR